MSNPVPFDGHDSPRMTRGVQALIAISAAVLFLQWTLVRDADVYAVLGFQDGSLERTLWSALSYMFVHYGLWHLLLNAYGLAVFGPRLESRMGTRAFVLYFLWCGLGGAMFHLLFLRSGLLIGSSAAVFGVMFAFCQQWPREEVLLFGALPARAWTLVMLLVTVTLGLGMLSAGDAAAGGDRWAHLAHVGGLAFGWLYFRTPPATSLDRLRQRISPAPDHHDDVPPRAVPRTLPRARTQRDDVDEIVAKSRAVATPRPAPPATRVVSAPVRTTGESGAAELDRVLDKISQSGLESLSSSERAVLEEMAKRLRGDSRG